MTWFPTRKRKEFLSSVIKPVHQRAGLGPPPNRFTTNWSEQTNRLIQEFVKSQNEGKNVDKFTFCVAILINQQEQAIELAIVGLGEYKKHLKVQPRYRKSSAEMIIQSWKSSSRAALIEFYDKCYVPVQLATNLHNYQLMLRMLEFTAASVLSSTSSPAMQGSTVSIQPMQSTTGF